MATQEFRFRYLRQQSSVVLDDYYLTIKQGLRACQLEIHRLKHFFVHVVPSKGIECLIGWETPEGKRKVQRIYANLGDPGFAAFAAALATARPDADLRRLSPKEAHQRLGAYNTLHLVPIIALAAAVVVPAVIFIPNLVHGFDAGQAVIDAASCRAGCAVASRNVTLVNGSLHDEYLTMTADDEETNHYLLFVPGDWKKTDAVYLVVKTKALSSATIDGLLEEEKLSGVLRDVLWEGLDTDYREEYRRQWGITIAPEARLVEYEADTHTDLIIALIVMGVVVTIMAAVSVLAIVKNR